MRSPYAGVEAMLRACGMRVDAALGHEIYLASPDPEHPSTISAWNRDEYLAATGQLQVARADGTAPQTRLAPLASMQEENEA